MPARPILILTALDAERRAIVGRLNLAPRDDRTDAGYAQDGTPILAMTCGLRAKLLGPDVIPSASRVILAGLAGGVDPSLKTGDVVIDGPIHTAAELVCTPADKAALFARTGAACVDMETHLVREQARAAGIPFTAVRVIMDSAHEALSPEVLRLIDDQGRPSVLALIGMLLRRPGLLGGLIRMRRTSAAALAVLGEAVRDVVKRPQPSKE
jgi:Phosphorylase superfamily